MTNQPYSEQYRLAGLEWADANAEADLLEGSKSSFVAQLITKQGDIPHNRAEAAVKASSEYEEFVERMVDARRRANKLRVQMEYLRMEFMREQGMNATRRAEMRL